MSQGPWKVEQRGVSWYVVHPSRKKAPKRIGPVRMTGKNYYDIAVREAERRNKLVK